MRLGPGVGVMGASMAGAAAVYPLTWAGDAVAAWDFAENAARWADSDIANVAATPGWTVNRASGGYALNAAGVLVPFSSGEARRTSKGLLVEGARTNLLTRSQEFDNAAWTKTRGTVTADYVAAPDGTVTADRLIEDSTASNTHVVSRSVTIATSTTYAMSAYAKAGARSALMMGVGDTGGTNSVRVFINLATGSVHSSTTSGAGWTLVGSGIEALANGWYRFWVIGTSAASTGGWCGIFMSNTPGTITYTGDGTSDLLIWGAQLEAASFPSSYIPTTTASVTRAGDEVMVTSVTGLAYPMTGLVHVCRAVDTAGSERWLHVDDGTANERFRLSTLSTDLFEGELVDGGASQAAVSVAGAMAVGTVYKGAARFALNDVQACRDGTLGTADTSATLPVSPNTIRFGAGISVTNATFGYVVRAAIYDYAMTNAQLQAATAA